MIKIITVGKIKEEFIKDSLKEYLKRLYKYTKINIIEIEDDNSKDINKSLSTEKDKILKYINEEDYIITLEIDGNMLDSISLSKKIEELFIESKKIVFIIGGSNGIHDDIKSRSNYKLSFSKLTFPHQLFRVILLEQIYRSFKIINKETYHK